MKPTLSSLIPLAPLVTCLSACPKPTELTPPEGPSKIYHYSRVDDETNLLGETIATATQIDGTDPYKIPGYGAVSEKQERELLSEMFATVQRIETACNLDLSRPQKNEIRIDYDRSECWSHWNQEIDPSCINPKDDEQRTACDTKEREFFRTCNSITNPSHSPDLSMALVEYPALTISAKTCVEGVEPEERCEIQSNGMIMEEFTDSGKFERGLRVICRDLRKITDPQ